MVRKRNRQYMQSYTRGTNSGPYGAAKRRLDPFPIIVGAIITFVILGSISLGLVWTGVTNTMSCTVNDKTATSTDQGTDYRVYTDDCGVLTVQDELFLLKYDAADRYNAVKVGNTYEFDTVGWRFPLFSLFPSIVEVR